MKNINAQIQDPTRPKQYKPKKITPVPILIKMLQTIDKVLKVTKKKKGNTTDDSRNA